MVSHHPMAQTDSNLERLLPRGGITDTLASTHPKLTADDYYFDSYSHYSIHRDMLLDEVRTDSYRDAICGNPHLFEGKTVLDVGCGTGILSLFAAKAGAAKVYAVDASNIAIQTKQVVKANGFEDIIEVIHGKIEEVDIPEGVDVIISEWMGYFLFCESMLDSVVIARDRWLKPDGIILPDRAQLYLYGVEDEGQRESATDFWHDVYGFDMRAFVPLVQSEPLVDRIAACQIITTESCFLDIDIATVKKEELAFAVPFEMTASETNICSSFVSHFDMSFNHGEQSIYIPTGPHEKSTHWQQASLNLRQALPLKNGDVIRGTIACRPNEKNSRDLDIAIEYGIGNDSDTILEHYRMR